MPSDVFAANRVDIAAFGHPRMPRFELYHVTTYARRDLNPHPEGPEPKPGAAANYATGACYSVRGKPAGDLSNRRERPACRSPTGNRTLSPGAKIRDPNQ